MAPRARLIFILLGWLGLVRGTAAQEETPMVPAKGSIYAAIGTFLDHRFHLFRSHPASLLAGSAFADRDMSDHIFRNSFTVPGSVLSLSVGKHPFRSGARKGPELTVGALITSNMGAEAYFERTVRVPYDTLISSQTGQYTVIDSVYTSRYEIAHRYGFVGLQSALILRTKRRFSLFGGIGAAGGLVYNVHTDVRHYNIATAGDALNTGGAPGSSVGGAEPDQQERVRNGTGIWWSWNVPLGIDYRLHRSHAFWVRLHIYQQVTVQMLYVDRPVLGYTGGMGLRSTVGLRVYL